MSSQGPNPARSLFDEDPDRYERIRPTYPAALFDALFDRLGESPRVLEVGPGTGQATSEFVARGAQVTVVELGRAFAERLRSTHPTIEVHHGSFETVELPLGSFDVVTAATAYHWVHERRVERPHELLAPAGLMAILDLIQVEDPIDGGYFDRVQPIYASFGNNSGNSAFPDRRTVRPRIADEVDASGLFASAEVMRVDWDQTYTSTQYRDLLMTYSGTLARPVGERRALVDALVGVIDDEFDGSLTRPLVAAMTLAQRLD